MEGNKIMEVKTEWNFKKEVDGYHSDNKTYNYVIPNELTVTITLDEYRSLLTKEADARRREAELNRWEREQEITKLKAENESLKSTIWNLTHPCKEECEGE